MSRLDLLIRMRRDGDAGHRQVPARSRSAACFGERQSECSAASGAAATQHGVSDVRRARLARPTAPASPRFTVTRALRRVVPPVPTELDRRRRADRSADCPTPANRGVTRWQCTRRAAVPASVVSASNRADANNACSPTSTCSCHMTALASQRDAISHTTPPKTARSPPVAAEWAGPTVTR